MKHIFRFLPFQTFIQNYFRIALFQIWWWQIFSAVSYFPKQMAKQCAKPICFGILAISNLFFLIQICCVKPEIYFMKSKFRLALYSDLYLRFFNRYIYIYIHISIYPYIGLLYTTHLRMFIGPKPKSQCIIHIHNITAHWMCHHLKLTQMWKRRIDEDGGWH